MLSARARTSQPVYILLHSRNGILLTIFATRISMRSTSGAILPRCHSKQTPTVTPAALRDTEKEKNGKEDAFGSSAHRRNYFSGGRTERKGPALHRSTNPRWDFRT